MTGELHISSLVVHARPATLAAVCAAIARLPGAEVHASNRQGKIVVTLETSDEGGVLARLDQIGRMGGVPLTLGGPKFGTFVQGERSKWKATIERSGATVD